MAVWPAIGRQTLPDDEDGGMSRHGLLLLPLLVLACCGIAACSVTGDATTADSPTGSEPSAANRDVSPTAAPQRAIQTTTNPEDTEMPGEDRIERAGCRRLADFESDDANRRWLVVNDNVMGGQSLGGLSFDGGTMVFEGEINTNGGGFSSVRLPLEPKALIGSDRIVFRARPDDRSYMVTFDDDLASRDRRVSHRAPIEFEASGQWQTSSVSFDALFPAIFGRPIDDLPFRKDLANRMGLMISDGVDGPFRLEIDWVDLCPG